MRFARDEGVREFPGIVTAALVRGDELGERRVAVRLEPAAAALSRSSDYRIYQGVTVPDLVSDLLSEAGVPFDIRVGGGAPIRDTAVMYGETPLAFLNRLMEQDGIYWFQGLTGTMT